MHRSLQQLHLCWDSEGNLKVQTQPYDVSDLHPSPLMQTQIQRGSAPGISPGPYGSSQIPNREWKKFLANLQNKERYSAS